MSFFDLDTIVLWTQYAQMGAALLFSGLGIYELIKLNRNSKLNDKNSNSYLLTFVRHHDFHRVDEPHLLTYLLELGLLQETDEARFNEKVDSFYTQVNGKDKDILFSTFVGNTVEWIYDLVSIFNDKSYGLQKYIETLQKLNGKQTYTRDDLFVLVNIYKTSDFEKKLTNLANQNEYFREKLLGATNTYLFKISKFLKPVI